MSREANFTGRYSSNQTKNIFDISEKILVNVMDKENLKYDILLGLDSIKKFKYNRTRTWKFLQPHLTI